jgi:hypothetical protein
MRLWSISTTVRNPERLRSFLRVLKTMEGEPFNKENQIKYQILLIKNRLYTPNSIPQKYKKTFKNPQEDITYKIAKEVFFYIDYNDPPMRGRQSVNPLNKLGFSIARDTYGPIKITNLGNEFLNEEYDISYIFFKSLLKLQFPNPWSRSFSFKEGFNVVPFISTLHLIYNVNRAFDDTGLSQDEFCLFVSSLVNYKLIEPYTKKIGEYRKAKDKKEFQIDFAKDFYKTKKLTKKQINNFFEYGDNIMRYFRLTRYFQIRRDKFGSFWRINLEPTRKLEIEELIKVYSGEPFKFKNIEEYIEYISDINQPSLPFEEISKLRKIADNLISSIKAFAAQNSLEISTSNSAMLEKDCSNFDRKKLKQYISQLRAINLSLKEKKEEIFLKRNTSRIKELITILENRKKIKQVIKTPERFEKVLTEALRIINDQIRIKPNYPMDDNGEPISHSPGGKPDIECYYDSFNAICEVTLDSSNFQWIRETQPVMRHLRNFEIKNSEKPSYCIFVAPRIHQDTLGQFWFAIKSGYDGSSQKIIPFNLENFVRLLISFLKIIENNKKYSHINLMRLFDRIIKSTEEVEGHSDWFNLIPDLIENWGKEIYT